MGKRPEYGSWGCRLSRGLLRPSPIWTTWLQLEPPLGPRRRNLGMFWCTLGLTWRNFSVCACVCHKKQTLEIATEKSFSGFWIESAILARVGPNLGPTCPQTDIHGPHWGPSCAMLDVTQAPVGANWTRWAEVGPRWTQVKAAFCKLNIGPSQSQHGAV